ncbi:sulfatase-like hydrolase/transferase [Gilvimarinus agarilyticus]|uniref:sulfatase-like hydrolase/transferase n=1 Tax=Gilvimarinus sp. 2_MG-2023 TaxID=3062666 RepID=UPI001C082D7C|nr:sulfatase-like hydrolase/transferase [Gilvimarinus sp. 2_MG-2023]MBU2886376.1 sulfatase-like hydrolase/transferase [Gilvimarinus agarilyticus]MDO6571055.1 sulfatase-like hydrolase/transferase [Gilvimarinus sp. 2_MG-2023]
MILNALQRSLSYLLGAVILFSTSAGAADERPNILLILADDLGYADVGFNGSSDITTPSLDELANEGVTFSQAYVAHAFCGPSRAGLMTGRYPHKFGSQFNLPDIYMSGGVGVPESEVFVSDVLQDSNYFTGAIGKWHLGETDKYHPNNRGFDEFYGFLNGGHNYFPEDFNRRYDALRAAGRTDIPHYLLPLEHNGQRVRETEYITDALSREAVKFVTDGSKKEQPWFLYLAYNAPHTPLQAKPEDMAKFPHIKDKKRKTYAGMVYALDRGVKRVIDTLKETGQYDNTVVVFLSDNGGKLSQGANNDPLRAGKGSALEGGFRVPMFVHWPGKIKSNSHYKHPVNALDLFPTFASLAEAELPQGLELDGENLWPALQTGESARKGETFFAMRHRGDHSDTAAIRDQWKAVRVGKEPWALYDVAADPAESKDLSEEKPNLLHDLVTDANVWSWTHVQPRWFHIQKEGFLWREESMPRFHETFDLLEGKSY